MAKTIWVNRSDLTDFIVHADALPELGEGEVRLRVESFSVTANNVTYAVVGDQFGYWNFFPADKGYGVVPVWGHATVEHSMHPEIAAGERVYGYLPMATHLDVLPASITAGSFRDAAAHRQAMSPIYNHYNRLAADPEHDPAGENERMLFAPLFKTGFLIQDFFQRRDWFGAEALILTSASSKTAMGLASCAKQLSPQIRRIGLTSLANVPFVEDGGLFDKVLAYDEVSTLSVIPAVSVDFAGNIDLLRNIHGTLGDKLKYSCLVGMTHVGASSGAGEGVDSMGGPQPILFFAPDHAVTAIKEMGPKAFGEAVARQWREFLRSVEGALEIDERRGLLAAAESFVATFNGNIDPRAGIIIRP